MKFLLYLSDFILPALFVWIVLYGMWKKIPVYEIFVEGAADGFHTVIGIMPTLVGLMVAVSVLRASGFLDFLAGCFGSLTELVKFPSELVPLALIRMFSSSAATGLLLDVFREHGVDSHIGKVASLMMSCTETIFYTMSVYFLAAKVKYTRYTLTGALLATGAGLAASVILANFM